MKKFYSLFFVALIALFGAKANAAALIGDAPLGGWDYAGGLAMELQNGIYTITVNDVPAGKYFAISPDGATGWGDVRRPSSNGKVPSGEWEETSTGSDNSWKTGAAGNYTFQYNPENQQVRVVAADVVVADPAFYLIGAFNGWDQENAVEFEKDGDTFTLTYTFSGEFKLKNEVGDWFGNGHTFTAEENSVELGENGDNFNIVGEAAYTLTIKDNVLTITGFGDEPVVDELVSVIIKGSADADWSNIQTFELTQNESNVWQLEDAVIPAGFEFKIVKNMSVSGEQWIGAVSEGDFWIDADFLATGSEITTEQPGENMYFPKAGKFSFYVPEDFSRLSVSGEFAPVTYALACAPAGDWEAMETKELELGEDNIWTLKGLEVTADTELKVVEIAKIEGSDDLWAWYGAVSDGNFWVDEYIGTEITLFMGGDYQNLYFKNEGKFDFSFNAETAALLIEASGEEGNPFDLNGDNGINVGDVAELYRALLKGENDPKYDLNNDGSINAGDVGALYKVILGQN